MESNYTVGKYFIFVLFVKC